MPHRDLDYIRNVVQDLNLNLGPETIMKIYCLLEQEVGALDTTSNQTASKYAIFAAVALVSEQEALPTLGDSLTQGNGIHIQTLFARLKDDMKIEGYLDQLALILQKSRQMDPNLSNKLKHIKLAHRIFTKYQRLIRTLNAELTSSATFDQNNSGQETIHEILADIQKLVWVAYLLLKYREVTEGKAVEELSFQTQTMMLGTVLLHVYLQVKEGGPQATRIKTLISKEFSENIWNMRDNLESLDLEEKVHTLLVSTLRRRNDRLKLEDIFEKRGLCRRLLDDLVTKYQNIISTRPAQMVFVDQAKFLKIDKGLQPQHIDSDRQRTTYLVKKINFDTLEISTSEQPRTSDQNQNNNNAISNNVANTPQKVDFSRFRVPNIVSPLIKRAQPRNLEMSPLPNKPSHTPLKSKLDSETWLDRSADSMNPHTKDYKELENYFEQLDFEYMDELGRLFKRYVHRAYPQLSSFKTEKLIKVFYYCVLLQCRVKDIIQRANYLNDRDSLRTLLCVLTQIYVQQSTGLPCKQFKDCANDFQVKYLYVFPVTKTLTRIDRSMPSDILKEVENIEKRILLIYIWEEGLGYQLLTMPEEEILVSPESSKIRTMEERLQKTTMLRICEIVNVTVPHLTEYTEKVKSVVAQIFNSKPFLLKNNYLDQIILCSLLLVLKIHLKDQAPTLQILFTKYSSLNFTYNYYKHKAYTVDGSSLNLLDFYNSIFQQEVREQLLDSQTNQKFLGTPIRTVLQNDFHLKSHQSPGFYRLSGQLAFKKSDPNDQQNAGGIFGSVCRTNLASRFLQHSNIPGHSSPRSEYHTPTLSAGTNSQPIPNTSNFLNKLNFDNDEQGSFRGAPLAMHRSVSFGKIPANQDGDESPNGSFAPTPQAKRPNYMEFSFGRLPFSNDFSPKKQ